MSDHIENKKLRKKQILESAKQLMLSQGIEATSISQIAKRADVAKSLVFYYFENKDEIIGELVNEICETKVKGVYQRIDENDGYFFRQLIVLIDSYYDVAYRQKKVRQYHRMIDDSLSVLFHQKFLEGTKNAVERVISEGQKLGYFLFSEPLIKFIVIIEGIVALTKIVDFNAAKIVELIAEMLELPKERLLGNEDLMVHIMSGGEL